MADYDSSLPIRTEAAGDVDVFISDATIPAQKLKVNADGSIDTNQAVGAKTIITDGTDDMEVNADGSINVVSTATDLDIRDLAFATDKVDVSGSTIAAITADVNIADGGNSITVDAVDLDIRDLVAATDSVQANLFDATGAAFSGLNPLPVSFSSDQSGDEVCDFNTSVAVAKDASVNHDYTVTALKTYLAGSAWISGSGKLKVEVLINASLAFVGFNSTANPNIEIPMDKYCKAAAGQVIRITITNLDNQAQDVYSTLLGLEV